MSSLASFDIQRSRVEMLPRFSDPVIYPLVRFRVPELPSLHRSHGLVPRASAVLLSSLTPHRPSGRARLPSPNRTACAPPEFALAAWGRPRPQAWIFDLPGPFTGSFFDPSPPTLSFEHPREPLYRYRYPQNRFIKPIRGVSSANTKLEPIEI